MAPKDARVREDGPIALRVHPAKADTTVTHHPRFASLASPDLLSFLLGRQMPLWPPETC